VLAVAAGDCTNEMLLQQLIEVARAYDIFLADGGAVQSGGGGEKQCACTNCGIVTLNEGLPVRQSSAPDVSQQVRVRRGSI